MNDVYANIVLEHQDTVGEIVSTVAKNMMIEVVTQKDPDQDKTKYMYYALDHNGHTDKEIDHIEKVKDVVGGINQKCMDDCSNAVTKTSCIGLSVPRTPVVAGDEELKKRYEEFRTVILDKFSTVKENGEGWVKFIDTLATPEERAENYKIPNFQSVYTQFLSDKQVDKVDKGDIKKAIEVICAYDKKMGQIIKEGKELVEDYKKKACLLMQREGATTLNQSLEEIAEAMVIHECDFLMAESLELRKKVLTEEVKNAQMILYSLASYNPHNLAESSCNIQCSVIPLICDMFNNAMDHPETMQKTLKGNMSSIIDWLDEPLSKVETCTKETLEKCKESAMKSSCAGIFLSEYAGTDSTYITNLNRLQAHINAALDKRRLEESAVERLVILNKEMKALRESIEHGNEGVISNMTFKNASVERCGKIAAEMVSSPRRNTQPKQITKEDVEYALYYLENARSNINGILMDYNAIIENAQEKDAFITECNNVNVNHKTALVQSLTLERYTFNDMLSRLKLGTILEDYTDTMIQSATILEKASYMPESSKENYRAACGNLKRAFRKSL